MALEIQIQTRISKDCSTLYISDLTGYYDADTNPGGYDLTGVVNLDPNDINTSTGTLKFVNTAGEVCTITLDPSDFDVSAIGTTGLISKSITFDTLISNGISTAADDIFTITYTFYANGTRYQKSCAIVKDCIGCCILNALLKDIKFCTTCDQKSITAQLNELMIARTVLDGAGYLAACGDLQGAKQALDYVTSFGDQVSCSSCK